MDRTFRIKKEGYKEMLLAHSKRLVPFYLILFSIVPIMFLFGPSNRDLTIYSATVGMIFILLMMGIVNFVVQRKKRIQMESYQFCIKGVVFIQEMNDFPTVSIPFYDVSEILSMPNGDLIIKRSSSTEFIGIPKQIEDYDELFEALNKVKSIQSYKGEIGVGKTFWIKQLAVVIMMGVVFTTRGILAGICALLLMIFMGYVSYSILMKGKTATKPEKQMLPFCILIILVMAYSAFNNLAQ